MRLILSKPWMHHVLVAAGIYNLVWGGIAVFWPNFFFDNLHLAHPNYMMMWQGIGVLVMLFGIGYLIASRGPLRHWPIVLLGFTYKLLVSLAYVYYYYVDVLPFTICWTVLANNVVWLLPFGLILFRAFEYDQANRELAAYDLMPRKLKSLGHIHTNTGENLQEVSEVQPTLLIFLRDFGCTFCRESLSEIASQRKEIEAQGTRIILVHMMSEEAANEMTELYGLGDLARISDPDRKVYNSFGLRRGNVYQLFGMNVMIRGFKAGVLDGHFLGRFGCDGFQMPGVFLIHKGTVLQTFRHTTAADRPDYIELARVDTSDWD